MVPLPSDNEQGGAPPPHEYLFCAINSALQSEDISDNSFDCYRLGLHPVQCFESSHKKTKTKNKKQPVQDIIFHEAGELIKINFAHVIQSNLGSG